MSKYLTSKTIVILLLVSLLLIPMGTITRLIQERAQYQDRVTQQVAQSTSHAQKLAGPILVIPYEVDVTTVNTKTGASTVTTQSMNYYVLPQSLHINTKAEVTPRKLGIYQAQVYLTEMQFNGNFGTINLRELMQKEGFKSIGNPYVAVSLSDTRGIMRTSQFTFNRTPLDFKEGAVNSNFGKGMHVRVDASQLLVVGSKNEFAFNLDIQGTQNLSIVPLGKVSELTMTSNWQHPNFLGDMLPKAHTITENGFTAQWQSTWFANNMNDEFGDNKAPDFKHKSLPTFSVSMIETVNQYQLNERTVKYAILFIGLAFIGFIAFEAISRLKIHPIQYALVGFALVMFYMLLLALSEHIGFNQAYAIAAASSSGLIGLYLCSVLKGVFRGAGFAGGLLGMYGLLFLILQSQDFALLFGSGLLFVVLGIIMLATRKVDWYQLGDSIDLSRVAKRIQTTGERQYKEESKEKPDVEPA